MKNLKKYLVILLAVVMVFSFASCKGNDTSTTTATQPAATQTPQVDVIVPSADYETKIRVASTNDFLGLVTSKIATDKTYACEMLNNCDSYEDVCAKLLDAQVDIGVLPLNKAVELFEESDGAIKIISASSGISLQVITSDESITSVSSLKGKTVYSAVKGTYAEDIVRYVFDKKGINFDSVVVSDNLSNSQIAEKAVAGEIEICILPEPYASSVCIQNESFSRAVSFNEEYESASGTSSLQGCFVARTEFIQSNPELVKEFMGFCEIFTNYFTSFTEGAAVELEANNYFSSSLLAYETIVNSNLKYADKEELVALAEANIAVMSETDVTASEICYTFE